MRGAGGTGEGDRGDAAQAGTARAAVDPVPGRAPSGRALRRIDVDGVPQPTSGVGQQRLQVGVRRRSPGIDAVQEQQLLRPHVPQPGDPALVQQRGENRSCPGGGHPGRRPGQAFVGRGRSVEQVRAEMADDPVLVAGAAEGEDGQVDPGERAVVVEAQRDPQPGRHGAGQPLARAQHRPPPAHAQVRVHGEGGVGTHEQVLAARHPTDDALPGQVRGGPPRMPDVASGDRATGRDRVQPGREASDAVAFGHPIRLRRHRASCSADHGRVGQAGPARGARRGDRRQRRAAKQTPDRRRRLQRVASLIRASQ